MTDPLALLEGYHEACAAVARAERAIMIALLPEELRPWARAADPASNEEDDIFGLLPDLAAVRVHRLPDEGVVVAERYEDGELVGEPLIVELDDPEE